MLFHYGTLSFILVPLKKIILVIYVFENFILVLFLFFANDV